MRKSAMVWGLAVTLGGCGADLSVAPRSAAPGEPLRVTLREAGGRSVAMVAEEASGRTLDRVDLHDAEDEVSVWLYPRVPLEPGPIAVVLRERGLRSLRPARAKVPLDLARPVASLLPLAGLHDREEAFGESFAWTSACALFELEDLRADVLLHLWYRCHADLPGQEVVLVPGGGEARRIPCHEGDATEVARIELDHELWGQSAFLPVEIRVEPPVRPQDGWGRSEPRELGIRYYRSVAARAVR